MSFIETLKGLIVRFGVKKATVLAFLVLYIAKETIGRKLYCKLKNYPPLVMPFPILGNFPYLSAPLEPPGNHINFLNLSKKYGPVYSLYFGSHYGIVLNDLDSFFEAMKTRQDDYARRPVLHSFEIITHGAGVAMNNGKRWRMIRTQLQKRATNKQKGEEMEPLIVEEVNSTLYWLIENKIKVGKAKDFDLRQLCRRESLNVAMRYLFSFRFGEDQSPQYYATQDWIRILFEFMAAGSPSDFMPIFKFFPNKQKTLAEAAAKKMESFIDSELVKHKQSFKKYLTPKGELRPITEAEEKDMDFIDQMLRSQLEAQSEDERVTDLDIRVCCWDAMAGQIDTSATTMEWMIYILINNRDVQRKVHKVLDEVVGPNRLPNLNDIPKLEYLLAIIDEVFRWKHFAPQGLPHETEVDTKMLGYNVPKGAQVFMNYHSTHMNPKYWKNPEQFRPERFLEEEKPLLYTVLHPETFFPDKESYKFVPFGQGRRRCVGYGIGRIVMWLKAAIWLHCFEWRSPEDKVENGEVVYEGKMDVATEYLGITLVPEDQKVWVVPRPAAKLLKPIEKNKIDTR